MGSLKVVSLFSGAGGMDLGMSGGFWYLDKWYSKNPVEIIYAMDNDKNACEIYNDNFDTKCILQDVKDLHQDHVPPHHALIGGFPCQSFSIVAQNPPRLGVKDEKGQLFFEMVRLLKEKKPLFFIAENVKGIISANHGEAFPLIIKAFEDASYYVKYGVLEASDYGVPQKRVRVFIVGFRDPRILDNFEFPSPVTRDEKVPLSKCIIPESLVEEKYFFSQKAIDGMEKVKDKMNKGRVQSPDQPCNTVSAHLAKVSLNSVDPVLKIDGRYRRFTPREAACIQSFPDSFKLTGADFRQYRGIGNAVPPVLMWHVTKAIMRAIRKTDINLLKSEPFRTPAEIRSFNMSMIRYKDTKPELILRKALSAKGYRYRINDKRIFGKPDIVFPSKKIAIFSDSSFWHGKDFEKTIGRIKTNREYWENKIKRNIERDKIVSETLQKQGWKVLRIWDEEIKRNLDETLNKLEKLTNSQDEN